MTSRLVRTVIIHFVCIPGLISSPALLAQELLFHSGSAADSSAVDAKGARHRGNDYPGRAPWMDDASNIVWPRYPYEEKVLRHTGSGLFGLTLDLNTGSVSKIRTLKSTGFPKLDYSATDAFRQWRWKPRKWKEIEIPVTFTLRRTGQAAELERYLESQRKESFERYRREHGVPSPTPSS